MTSQYDKKRPNIPENLKRIIAIESGHACAVKDCIEHTYNEYHHIDGNRENNSPDNLIYLCDKHHKMAHKGIIDRESLKIYKKTNQNSKNKLIIEDNKNIHNEDFEIIFPKLRHMDVLMDRVIFTTKETGIKLYELWRMNSRNYPLCDFCRVCNIKENEIGDYFSGKKALQLQNIQLITKIFDLSDSYFFEGTYWLRKAYWKDDIVKYSILSMVFPKSNIREINNQGDFYGGILYDLAINICELYQALYQEDENKLELSENIKSKLELQYYKVLEEYPEFENNRETTKAEKILRGWFFASDDFIARVIIESIQHINITNIKKPIILYRFHEDVRNKEVKLQDYDEDSLKMKTT